MEPGEAIEGRVVHVLDYGVGNVRSLVNAVESLGYLVEMVTLAEQMERAERLIFPGVGAFSEAMQRLTNMGLVDPLKDYLSSGKPFLGICIGMQILFEGSEESPEWPGLGVIPGQIRRFETSSLSVPHMGWNGVTVGKHSSGFLCGDELLYFVHSYCALETPANSAWVAASTDYGHRFVSAVEKGAVFATQFHPEKSGTDGIKMIGRFLANERIVSSTSRPAAEPTQLVKRIVACLDVRSNDVGDLVVTKGDQYNVRECGEHAAGSSKKGAVRNLGKPVALARRYYDEGADEICFLNITSFRSSPLDDIPMLRVLEAASKEVFVPLTIGGGIRDFTDLNGKVWSALDVASRYFRAGADKVSLGSDAVFATESYLKNGKIMNGRSSIEQISNAYGRQAVVISVDPRRVYVADPSMTSHATVALASPDRGPLGEMYCWYQCTVKGGREGRDLDVVQLSTSCEALGAGEILLNCIDRDGTKSGFELKLIDQVRSAVSIPVIASSGAGSPQHFIDLFHESNVEAALAAGIFHRREVPIQEVKRRLNESRIVVRNVE